MIERHKEDIISQLAASTEYTAQALRAMRGPRGNPQLFHMFGTHSNSVHALEQAQSYLDSLNEESIRTHLRCLQHVNESLNACLHEVQY